MDKERLKLIVRNLESLVGALKSETYRQVKQKEDHISDYDEIFEDDDGYPD